MFLKLFNKLRLGFHIMKMTVGIALVVIVNDKRAEADLIHKLYVHSK